MQCCKEQGLLIRAVAGNSIAFCPPLIITREQVDEMIELFDRALAMAADAIRREMPGNSQVRQPMRILAPELTSKKTILSLGLLCGLVLAGCGPAEQGPPAEVDLILTNGKVLTVDENFSIHDTVVVDEGLIVATGGAALLQSYDAGEVVDLRGKVLMPGFIDSHTHIRGRPNHYIDLTEAGSVAEIQQLVRAKAEEVGAGNWVTGYGWSEDQLTEGPPAPARRSRRRGAGQPGHSDPRGRP